jgi:hypothetical protein
MTENKEEKTDTFWYWWCVIWFIIVVVWYALHTFWRKFPFKREVSWKPWVNVYGGKALTGDNKGSYFCQTKKARLGDMAEFGVGLIAN